MWHSDKAYLPDVVEGTGAWDEKKDKIILDNNLIINPVSAYIHLGNLLYNFWERKTFKCN